MQNNESKKRISKNINPSIEDAMRLVNSGLRQKERDQVNRKKGVKKKKEENDRKQITEKMKDSGISFDLLDIEDD
ncbi:MAG: hypothetical protein ACOC5T_02030 [Elusimicrobiota bacterium]